MKHPMQRMATVILAGWLGAAGTGRAQQPAEPEGRDVDQFPITYEPNRPLTQIIPDPDSIDWRNIRSRPGYRYRGMLPLHRRFYDYVRAKCANGEALTPGEQDAIQLLQSVRRWPEAPVPSERVLKLLRYLRDLKTDQLNLAQSLMVARAIHAGVYPHDPPRNPGADRLARYVQNGPFESRNPFEWAFGRVEPWLDWTYGSWGYDMTTPPGSTTAFPAEPFNGMQINCTVAGAALGEPKDEPGFTTSRSYKGTLTGSALSLSGSVSMSSGYGAHVLIRVWCGSEEQRATNYLATPPNNQANTWPVNLSVPRAENVRTGGFLVQMDGSYSMGGGHRGLIMRGTFGPTPEELAAEQAAADAAWRREVDATLADLGFEKTRAGADLEAMRAALAGGDAAWADYVNRLQNTLGYRDLAAGKDFIELRTAMSGDDHSWAAYVRGHSKIAPVTVAGASAMAAAIAATGTGAAGCAWTFGNPAAVTVATPAKEAAAGAMSASFTGLPAEVRKDAWIGVFREGADHRSYTSYTFIPSLEKDTYAFDRPREPGRYEVRLFLDDSNTELATSEGFDVGAAN